MDPDVECTLLQEQIRNGNIHTIVKDTLPKLLQQNQENALNAACERLLQCPQDTRMLLICIATYCPISIDVIQLLLQVFLEIIDEQSQLAFIDCFSRFCAGIEGVLDDILEAFATTIAYSRKLLLPSLNMLSEFNIPPTATERVESWILKELPMLSMDDFPALLKIVLRSPSIFGSSALLNQLRESSNGLSDDHYGLSLMVLDEALIMNASSIIKWVQLALFSDKLYQLDWLILVLLLGHKTEEKFAWQSISAAISSEKLSLSQAKRISTKSHAFFSQFLFAIELPDHVKFHSILTFSRSLLRCNESFCPTWAAELLPQLFISNKICQSKLLEMLLSQCSKYEPLLSDQLISTPLLNEISKKEVKTSYVLNSPINSSPVTINSARNESLLLSAEVSSRILVEIVQQFGTHLDARMQIVNTLDNQLTSLKDGTFTIHYSPLVLHRLCYCVANLCRIDSIIAENNNISNLPLIHARKLISRDSTSNSPYVGLILAYHLMEAQIEGSDALLLPCLRHLGAFQRLISGKKTKKPFRHHHTTNEYTNHYAEMDYYRNSLISGSAVLRIMWKQSSRIPRPLQIQLLATMFQQLSIVKCKNFQDSENQTRFVIFPSIFDFKDLSDFNKSRKRSVPNAGTSEVDYNYFAAFSLFQCWDPQVVQQAGWLIIEGITNLVDTYFHSERSHGDARPSQRDSAGEVMRFGYELPIAAKHLHQVKSVSDIVNTFWSALISYFICIRLSCRRLELSNSELLNEVQSPFSRELYSCIALAFQFLDLVRICFVYLGRHKDCDLKQLSAAQDALRFAALPPRILSFIIQTISSIPNNVLLMSILGNIPIYDRKLSRASFHHNMQLYLFLRILLTISHSLTRNFPPITMQNLDMDPETDACCNSENQNTCSSASTSSSSTATVEWATNFSLEISDLNSLKTATLRELIRFNPGVGMWAVAPINKLLIISDGLHKLEKNFRESILGLDYVDGFLDEFESSTSNRSVEDSTKASSDPHPPRVLSPKVDDPTLLPSTALDDPFKRKKRKKSGIDSTPVVDKNDFQSKTAASVQLSPFSIPFYKNGLSHPNILAFCRSLCYFILNRSVQLLQRHSKGQARDFMLSSLLENVFGQSIPVITVNESSYIRVASNYLCEQALDCDEASTALVILEFCRTLATMNFTITTHPRVSFGSYAFSLLFVVHSSHSAFPATWCLEMITPPRIEQVRHVSTLAHYVEDECPVEVLKIHTQLASRLLNYFQKVTKFVNTSGQSNEDFLHPLTPQLPSEPPKWETIHFGMHLAMWWMVCDDSPKELFGHIELITDCLNDIILHSSSHPTLSTTNLELDEDDLASRFVHLKLRTLNETTCGSFLTLALNAVPLILSKCMINPSAIVFSIGTVYHCLLTFAHLLQFFVASQGQEPLRLHSTSGKYRKPVRKQDSNLNLSNIISQQLMSTLRSCVADIFILLRYKLIKLIAIVFVPNQEDECELQLNHLLALCTYVIEVANRICSLKLQNQKFKKNVQKRPHYVVCVEKFITTMEEVLSLQLLKFPTIKEIQELVHPMFANSKSNDLSQERFKTSPLPNLISYEDLLPSEDEAQENHSRGRKILSINVPSWVLLPHLDRLVRVSNHTDRPQAADDDHVINSLAKEKVIPTINTHWSSHYDYDRESEDDFEDEMSDGDIYTELTEFHIIADRDG